MFQQDAISTANYETYVTYNVSMIFFAIFFSRLSIFFNFLTTPPLHFNITNRQRALHMMQASVLLSTLRMLQYNRQLPHTLRDLIQFIMRQILRPLQLQEWTGWKG